MENEEKARHARLEQLYDEASQLSGDERSSFLAEACADDDSLREEVEQLIGMESKLDSFDSQVIRRHLRELEGLPDPGDLDAEMSGWLPERIGTYAIIRQIGIGGMGVVFEALQDSPKRRVALKLSNPMATTEASLERLRLEAEYLGRLHHPGIAQVYEAGVHQLGGMTQPYFAMEYIDGQSLLSHASEKRLQRRARIELLISVCDAVHHAHEQGVVHRDLKPDNIFVDTRGQPKLLDFGVARLIETADETSALRTRAGELLGTLAYMAPEQAVGRPEEISASTDVFSLGVIAYELLCGHLPRDVAGMNVTAALEVVSEQDARRLKDSLEHVEKDLDTVIGKAMELRQRDRYRTAAEFGADLRRVLERRSIQANPPTVIGRLSRYARRNRLLVSSVAAIGLLLSISLVLAIRNARRETDRRRATMSDLYASEMLRVTDALSRVSGMPELDELVGRWLPESSEIDLRGWEWQFLNGLRQRQGLAIPLDGTGMAVDWHPSGEQVVVSTPSEVMVFDVATQERVAHWLEDSGRSFFLTGARFSPDGERVLFYGWNLLGMWRVGSPEPEWLLADGPHHGGAWDPNGAWVVASDEKRRSLVRYDATSGEEVGILAKEARAPESRNVSSDGRWTTVFGSGFVDRLINIESGRARQPSLPTHQQVMSMMIDPYGERLAESGWSNVIRIYPLDDPAAVIEIRDHNEQVDCIAWHPTENELASGSGDSSVRLYNAGTGTLMEVFRGHTDRVRAVRWSPDGSQLASVSDDQKVRIWDRNSAAAYRRRTVMGPDEPPLFSVQLSFSRDSSFIHVSTRRSAFTISMPEARVVHGDDSLARRLESFSHDGRFRTFTRRRDGGFEVVAAETDTGRELWSMWHEANEPTVRAWHPTEAKLIAGHTQSFKMLDFGTEPRVMWEQPANDRVWGGTFDTDGSRVVLIEDLQPTRVVAVESGEVLASIALPEGCIALGAAFRPDGELLALCFSDAVVRVYDPASANLVHELKGHSGKVYCAGWHPNEPRLATGSTDGSVRLWDTTRMKATGSFQCGGPVKALAWDHGGSILAAITATGTIHLWEALSVAPSESEPRD